MANILFLERLTLECRQMIIKKINKTIISQGQTAMNKEKAVM